MPAKARAKSTFLLLSLLTGVTSAAEWQGQRVTRYVESLVEQGLNVIYSSDLLSDDLRVLAEPPAGEPADALRGVLAPHGLELQAGSGDRFLIVRSKCPPGLLRIAVRDRITLLPLADAVVSMAGGARARTDENGIATIACLVPRPSIVTVSAEEYAPESVSVAPETGRTVDVSVALDLAEEPLTEIVVSSSVYNLVYQTSGSHRFLERDLTTRLPDVGDEAIRAIDRLPGTANGGLSTKTHVRGGGDSEQLIMLDGLRLYEPFHLKDFLSFSTAIDPQAIAGIDFYSAGYPARYGDRMSGVIDISLREPPTENLTTLGLSLFTTSLLSAGRFGEGRRGDWLATVRRGNLDLVAQALDPEFGEPLTVDALAHVGWELGSSTYLSANLLHSFDKITLADGEDEIETARARYSNLVFWLKAETDWSDRLSSRTIASITDIANERTGEADNPGVVSGSTEDDRDFQVVALRQDWSFDASRSWSLRSGFDVKKQQASYRYVSQRDIAAPFDGLLDNTPVRVLDLEVSPDGNQYAVYAEARWRASDRLVVDLGLRWDKQTYTLSDSDDQWSPRLNALYEFGERTRLRLSAGRFYQAQEINELQIIDGVDRFFQAQRATHFVAGFEQDFAGGTSLQLEVYRKEYHKLIPRYENILDPIMLLPDLQVDRARIDATRAVAEGAELMLSAEHDEFDLQWWVSYGWSQTRDRVQGGFVPRSWDQTNALKFGLNWDWQSWSFSAAGSWHTGWPRTEILLTESADPAAGFDIALGPRNAERYSVFHTLDARASRSVPVRIGELTAFVELTNLYNRKNGCCTEFERVTDEDGNDVLRLERRNWLPIVPSIGVLWSF